MKKKLSFALASFSVFLIGFLYFSGASSKDAIANEIVVYQSKTCGCCKKWVNHLQDNGFKVRSELMDDVTDVKLKMNVPMKLASCHTAVVNGYVVEGHLPASAIKKLITENPSLKGISVPGMPMGSPGMEGSYKEAYDVIAIGNNGEETIFAKF